MLDFNVPNIVIIDELVHIMHYLQIRTAYANRTQVTLKAKTDSLGLFFLLFPVCVQYDGQCVSLQILVIFPIGSWTTPPQDLMV